MKTVWTVCRDLSTISNRGDRMTLLKNLGLAPEDSSLPITNNSTPETTPDSIIFYPICKNIPECKTNIWGDYLINTHDEWKSLWDKMFPPSVTPTGTSVPPIPEVDFTKATILAVFTGLIETPSHIKEIQSIWNNPENKCIKVNIQTFITGDTCIKPKYRCNIYHIVAIPKQNQKIRFFHLMPGVYNCFQ